MGSDESHFNVSLIMKGKVGRHCPQITIFVEREPKRNRTKVLLLDETPEPPRLKRLTDNNNIKKVSTAPIYRTRWEHRALRIQN